MMEMRACFEYMASQWTDDTLLVTSAGHSSGIWWDVTKDTDRAFYLTASMSLSSMFASGVFPLLALIGVIGLLTAAIINRFGRPSGPS